MAATRFLEKLCVQRSSRVQLLLPAPATLPRAVCERNKISICPRKTPFFWILRIRQKVTGQTCSGKTPEYVQHFTLVLPLIHFNALRILNPAYGGKAEKDAVLSFHHVHADWCPQQ